ncbi:MAG: hypothetical protein U1F66_06605 [bacterium]
MPEGITPPVRKQLERLAQGDPRADFLLKDSQLQPVERVRAGEIGCLFRVVKVVQVLLFRGRPGSRSVRG